MHNFFLSPFKTDCVDIVVHIAEFATHDHLIIYSLMLFEIFSFTYYLLIKI